MSDIELEAVDRALVTALNLRMFSLGAYLAIEQVRALHWRYEFGEAITYGKIALSSWHAHLEAHDDSPGESETDPSTELWILNLLATQYFRVGDYELGLQHLRAADRLVALASPTLLTAKIAWMRALFEQWRNAPRVALDYAMKALATYLRIGSPLEQARLRLDSAHIAMDCAVGAFNSGLILIADEYVKTAYALLDFPGLPVGTPYREVVEMLYHLAYARYSSLIRRNEDRRGLIESVRRNARSLDPSVVGKAYLTLGDELYSQPGGIEEARTCYRLAIDILETSHTPAFATQPRQRLALIEEMSS